MDIIKYNRKCHFYILASICAYLNKATLDEYCNALRCVVDENLNHYTF